jgi:hypothetical protein
MSERVCEVERSRYRRLGLPVLARVWREAGEGFAGLLRSKAFWETQFWFRGFAYSLSTLVISFPSRE